MTTPEDPFAAPTEGVGSVPSYGQAGGFASPPPYGVAGPVARNGLGTAALVLGILAILGSITVVLGVVLGVIAIVLGAIGRGRAKRGEASNGGSALAGLICGVVGIALSATLIAVGVSLFNSDSGKQLQDCLNKAGSDATAQQKCQVEFTNNFR